jgi:hypothetical protein
MEMKVARRIGGGISVQTLLYIVAFLEVFGLIEETRGDFANGILFFLYEQLNPFKLGVLAIIFTLTYFLGRNAGKEILIHGRNLVRVGMKYSFLMIGILAGGLFAIYAANHAPQSAWKSLPSVLLSIAISMLVAWMWAVWRIKRKCDGGGPAAY